MWFPTKTKVQTQLMELILRLEGLNPRIEQHESKQRAVGMMFGIDHGLLELRSLHDDMYETLQLTLGGVSVGDLPYKGVAKQLSDLDITVQRMEDWLNQADADSTMGEARFQERFGEENKAKPIQQEEVGDIQKPIPAERMDQLVDLAMQLAEADAAFSLKMKTDDLQNRKKAKNAPNN